MATDEPPVLLPCAICTRTFMPQSLEKHRRICERAAIKKRKPFDSAKQRIQGTDLAEFLPKETTKKKVYQEEKPMAVSSKGSWKQTHDEFIRAIQAAREETTDAPPQRQSVATNQVTVGVPTRPNEKGMCPTCNRLFSIKAYERHVAWCKERVTRMPINTVSNVAKERLEARMKYRAPLLKNRRITNREKYSPASAINLPSHGTKNSIANSRAKESASTPNCNSKGENESATGCHTHSHQKPTTNDRRPSQGPEGISSGPVKSRISDRSSRSSYRESRASWSNYVRRRPDFNLVLTGRTGSCKDYDPYVLAERQMNELISDTCSDQSVTDYPTNVRDSSSSSSGPNYPLSHSSAFVKYPNPVTRHLNNLNNRVSLIAPPSEFDDLAAGFSSDSTETNSISREILTDLEDSRSREKLHDRDNKTKDSRDHVLGRRVIIDKSKALGTNEIIQDSGSKNLQTNDKARKFFDKVALKIVKPHVTRSNSVRATSAPKAPERKNNNSSVTATNKINSRSNPASGLNNRNNNYESLSGSNLSLSSIVSSEVEVKRSNSLFDELASSFEDDASCAYPSLRSLLKNDSLSVSSPVQSNRPRNGIISDEELSSPDSYKRQDHSKLSADSAYSSLNRKYSNHGRNTNEEAGRQEDDSLQRRRDGNVGPTSSAKCKLSKFCHECGCKFPETAKYCCECGIRRLTL